MSKVENRSTPISATTSLNRSCSPLPEKLPGSINSAIRFCFRPIAPYSELNGRENSDSLACQCDEASGMRLLSDFNRYAQESGFFLSDPGFYSERGGLVCYASKINTYVVNVRREIQKCTVALDQGINKLSVLTRENIDSLTVRWQWTWSPGRPNSRRRSRRP